MSSGNTYILISPVKDEEKYIERTIQSVLQQTIKPQKWVIVDDGSRDRTPIIVDEYTRSYPWITKVTLVRDGKRQPGSGIIRAFMAGYESVRNECFDFVVKFDCDIDFPPHYFEELITRFQQDDKLGIASGIYLEERKGQWVPVKMPLYHAAGGTKMVRKECFADIGGFVVSRGWDTVDEIRAQKLGWKTLHFDDLYFRHLKKEGSGIGFLRTNMMHGEIYYLTGGGKLFFTLKFLARLVFGYPFLLGGIMMLWGYLKPSLTGKPRLVSVEESKLYQSMLNQRILDRLSTMFGRHVLQQ